MYNNSKLLYGVAVNDADYVVVVRESLGRSGGKQKQRLIWKCPYYSVWSGMLARCYSKSFQQKSPSYIDCTVCEEWLRFSNFKRWMEQQDWEGKELDKDLLVRGNRVYSPQTCIFLDAIINCFINEAEGRRGEYLIGVNFDRATAKFRASCSNPLKGGSRYIGLFHTEAEAHEAWLKKKLEIAYELSFLQTDPRISRALVERYTNYVPTI